MYLLGLCLRGLAGTELSCRHNRGKLKVTTEIVTYARPWRKDRLVTPVFLGFPGGSDGKESTCNAGGLDLIPELGRSPGEGNGNPLQCSWASLVAQLVKNPPAMREAWV